MAELSLLSLESSTLLSRLPQKGHFMSLSPDSSFRDDDSMRRQSRPGADFGFNRTGFEIDSKLTG
jgi:hypothetical protein